MPTPVDQNLLRLAIIQVDMRVRSGSKRPMRRYVHGDGSRLVSQIERINALYHEAEKEGRGKGARDFQNIKTLVVEGDAELQGWSIEARNFHSSVIATFYRLRKDQEDGKSIVLTFKEFAHAFLIFDRIRQELL